MINVVDKPANQGLIQDKISTSPSPNVLDAPHGCSAVTVPILLISDYR